MNALTSSLTTLSLTLATALTPSLASPAAIADHAASTADTTANLVIYRHRQNAMLSYLDYRLYLNGKNIGKLKNNSIKAMQLAPGHYTIQANDHNRSNIRFEIKGGETTIIRTAVNREWQMSLATIGSDEATAEQPDIAKYLPSQEEHHYSLNMN